VKKLQQIITTYQHKGLLTSSSSISQGVLYNNITALVGRIDTAMKSFLALDNIDQFNTWTKGGDNGISITFSGALMASMQRQYSCARGSSTVSDTGEVITNICDKNSQQLNANMDKISNDAKASIAASRKKIDDAFIRLKSVITSSWSDMFTLSKHSQVTTDDGGAISKWRSLLVDNETKTSSSSLDAVRYTNTTTTTTATDTDFGTWMTDSMRPLLANQKVDLDAANF